MSAKIIIERKFKETPTPENFRVINDLRRKAMRQKGYISGETLADFDNNHVVVLSTWSSLDPWKWWVNSEERKVLEKELLKLKLMIIHLHFVFLFCVELYRSFLLFFPILELGYLP